MALHHELSGVLAVHPFAFVQATDPALVAANNVTAFKAWIDTSSGNTLKIRNAANSAWDVILSPGLGLVNVMVAVATINYDAAFDASVDMAIASPWYTLTYI